MAYLWVHLLIWIRFWYWRNCLIWISKQATQQESSVHSFFQCCIQLKPQTERRPTRLQTSLLCCQSHNIIRAHSHHYYTFTTTLRQIFELLHSTMHLLLPLDQPWWLLSFASSVNERILGGFILLEWWNHGQLHFKNLFSNVLLVTVAVKVPTDRNSD